MKKFMQRLLQMTTVLALVVMVGITMAACGGNSNNEPDGGVNNIDNLKGLYANIEAKKIYYFDVANNKYNYAEFSISDELNENGLYTLDVKSLETDRQEKFRLRVSRGTQAVSVYKVWTVYPGAGAGGTTKYDETQFIATYQDSDSQDLSKQFRAKDDDLVYTKILSLNKFLVEAFPDKEIDTTDVTITCRNETVWEALLLLA